MSFATAKSFYYLLEGFILIKPSTILDSSDIHLSLIAYSIFSVTSGMNYYIVSNGRDMS